MSDRYPDLSLGTSCTYAPTYGRCDVGGAYAWGKGKKKLTLDVNAHHEESFDGLGIPTTGFDASFTAKKWFLNAMLRHVEYDKGNLHSQSGAVEFGVGGGYRTNKHFSKYFTLTHLFAGGLILQDQLIGNLSAIDGERVVKNGGLFFWPIIKAEQTLSFKRKWLSARLNHGINLFAQMREEFLKSDTNSFLPDWHLNAELTFRPSHWWRKKVPLDMEVVLGARYFSGYLFDGFGENADIHAGVNIGQSLKKLRWSLSTKYTQPIRRDLHAADALPVGRLQSLKTDGLMVWEPTPKHSLLLSLGFATHFKDNDAMWFVAPPMRDYIHAGVGYQHGPASVFARVMAMPGSPKTDIIATLGASFNFNFFNGRSVPIESLQPAMPKQHLPVAAKLGVGRFTYKIFGDRIFNTDDESFNQQAMLNILGNFGNSIQGSSSGSSLTITLNGPNGSYNLVPSDLIKSVDTILNSTVSGKQKAQQLIKFGKQQKGEAELFVIIAYVVSRYTVYDQGRYTSPLDTSNWNTWGLSKVLGQKNRVCRDAAKAVYEFLKGSGIPESRLKIANVSIAHRVLFFQIKGGSKDGHWLVLDQSTFWGPIPVKSFKEALKRYTPASYGRGWLEPGKGPFGTNRYKMGFTGQWQRMRKAARRLVTPRR